MTDDEHDEALREMTRQMFGTRPDSPPRLPAPAVVRQGDDPDPDDVDPDDKCGRDVAAALFGNQ
jgi:hypothetical protein